MRRNGGLLLLALGFVVGCGTVSGGGSAIDAGDEGCKGHDDCPGEQVCDTNNGQCFECLMDTHCSPQAPICDQNTNTCVGCESHQDCESGVCDAQTGQCVPEERILYVNHDSPTPGGQCFRDQPCLDPTQAAALFSAERDWMLVIPAAAPYDTSTTVTYTDAKICAEGAAFGSSGGPTANPAFVVALEADLTIYGGHFGASDSQAIDCQHPQAGNDRVTSVRVIGAEFDQVKHAALADNCNIEITDSIFTDLTDIAVSVIDAYPRSLLVFDRNRVTGGQSGVITFSGKRAFIRNNLMIGNVAGDPALHRLLDFNGSGSAFIAYNTIMMNGSDPAELEGCVAWCAGAQVEDEIIFNSNIIWGNSNFNNHFIECTRVNNNVIDIPEAQKPSYPGNIFQAPMLVDPVNGNFTPQGGSPAVDKGDPLWAPPTDLVGTGRTAGTGPDVGAFELAP